MRLKPLLTSKEERLNFLSEHPMYRYMLINTETGQIFCPAGHVMSVPAEGDAIGHALRRLLLDHFLDKVRTIRKRSHKHFTALRYIRDGKSMLRNAEGTAVELKADEKGLIQVLNKIGFTVEITLMDEQEYLIDISANQPEGAHLPYQ